METKKNLMLLKRLSLSVSLVVGIEYINYFAIKYLVLPKTLEFINLLPYIIASVLFFRYSSTYDYIPFKEVVKNLIQNTSKQISLFFKGFGLVFLMVSIIVFVLSQTTNAINMYENYSSFSVIFNRIIRSLSYVVCNILMFLSFLKICKNSINVMWIPVLYAITTSSINLFVFNSPLFSIALPNALVYLAIGYSAIARQTTFALGFGLAYDMLPTSLLCACAQLVAGIFSFSGVSEMGYTPAFLYSFQLLLLASVAAYYGRLAYLVSMNRAELVDRGYMMVTDKHGVETPMLRATYQYNVMQAIKPWIAITEAGKKRHRGMVITQKLQKGWAFHEVFNAQGERLTHGFVDANMDLERMPESRLQDNRPKLAIAWELDTEALYYLRVEFEGETLYGALRMFFSAEERAKQPQTFAYKLSNTWIHPNEEEILSCVLYKANGEEVLVKALYGKYHEHCSF